MKTPNGHFSVVYKESPRGGLLVYFGQETSAEYWDELWTVVKLDELHARSEAGHLPHQLRRTFLRWVPGGARVLEAGCGLGHFTIAAHSLGYRAEGVDYAPKVVSMLKERHPEIPFFQGDVRNLHGIESETYDAVYSPGVCEHFEDGPHDVLREAHRVLRTGGILLVSTPYFNAYRRMVKQLGGFAAEPSGEFFQYAFSSQEIHQTLAEIGFKVLAEHPYGALKTIFDHTPLVSRLPLGRLSNPLAAALDTTPGIRRWGHACIWIARK